tara:strand:+ start:115 stop:306 length:192 start_codon:yes stop_codon:yes gene_type:complete
MITNLSGSNIQNTYQQVIHTPNNTNFYNGTGSIVNLALENTNVTFTNITASGSITGIINGGIF